MAVPQLSQIWRNLSEDERSRAIDPATGRVVVIVREPRARLWSAWCSKVLAGGVYFDFYYGPGATLAGSGLTAIRSVDDLVTHFSHFVADLAGGHALLDDPHFIPQATLLSWVPANCHFVTLSEASTVLDLVGPRPPGANANSGAVEIGLPRLPLETEDLIAGVWGDDADLAHFEPPRAPVQAEVDWDRMRDRLRAGRRLIAYVRRVEELEHLLHLRTNEGEGLSATVARQEEQLADARRATHEADARAHELGTELHVATESLNTVFSSRSWRLTWPLRRRPRR